MFNWRKKEKQPRAEKYGNIIKFPPPTSRPPHPPPPRQSKKDNSQQININVKIESKSNMSKYGVLDSEILAYMESIILLIYLEATGCNLNLDKLRLPISQSEIQSKIYIIQKCVYPLGYDYKWYFRAPYCSEIYDAITHINKKIEVYKDIINSGEYTLKDEIKEIIRSKFKIIDNEKPEKINAIDWYEVVSLVIFVDDNWSNDDDVVVQKTGEKLVWIEDEHIKKALEVVRKLGTLQ